MIEIKNANNSYATLFGQIIGQVKEYITHYPISEMTIRIILDE